MGKKLVFSLVLSIGMFLTSIAGAANDVADGEISVAGTVSGSYTDTQSSDNSYESIQEIESGGKPANRHSYLEHKWTINVTGTDPVTFYVEAYHTSNSEGDEFLFAYSTNDSVYTDMLTVTKTNDDDANQSYELPGGTSGTVYIRVKDTDQSTANKTLDTIYVDHMYIESVSTVELDPDLNDDGAVDGLDLGTFVQQWLAVGCVAEDWCAGCDFDYSGSVDFNDYGVLADDWLFVDISPANECENWQSLHPEWIFCDDFESDTAMVRDGRYFEYSNNGGDFAPIAGVGLDASKGMRVIFQQGEVSAGSLKLGFGRNPNAYMNKGIRSTEDFREVYYRMYLKMQDGWTGSPAKLSRATCFSSSTDWSQAMIAHLWSSGDYLLVDPVRCVDPVTSLVKCVGYNDFGNMDWIGNLAGVTPIFDSVHDGIWYCVEARVKLNDSGSGNGIQDFWIDGNLEARRAGLNFVASYTDYAINAIFFENYWNSGSPQLQERYFDNIVVSTQPIGP
ncbi:MAG: hypothetical protein ACYS1A_13065 [Planctomycetota bacterium]|jgi:hypothetical protein